MRENTFTTIRTEGALLPPETLRRVAERDADLGGFSPDAYRHPGERLNEVINRTWNTLQGIWASFSREREKLADDDPATGLTRSRWLLPLLRELDFDTPQVTETVYIDGRAFPISHRAGGVPLHLVGAGVDLDRRTRGVAGAAQSSPHSLMQSFLNHDETTTWGVVSNGHKLRLLRDSAALTRQAYVEFDLRGMMDGEQYADFVVLWLTCHASRFENGRECWLEKWAQAADKQGQRALDTLRDGVQAAIEALGAGFVAHAANGTLRDRLQSGELSTQDYYRQLLRIVYRLLVMFVGEDRELLHDPATKDDARARYMKYYSTRRLRTMAERFAGTAHSDLWESLRLVMHILGGEALTVPQGEQNGNAAQRLGLPVLGSFLFSARAVPDLHDAALNNNALLAAVRALAYTEDKQARILRPVDYRHLGAEELGSVYESLLELHPHVNIPAREFALQTAAGSERKTTGSYYTPRELVDALLKSALDPVIAEAISPQRSASSQARQSGGRSVEERLLALKVCDPACGSGHFLIAAGQRIALALAQARSGEESPTPDAVRDAMRDVVSHCLYGVDLNEMAVELCKVSLWMEALEPGKPLSFLEHRIQHGNSLLGTTPELMADGIPDEAFAALGDDDKAAVSEAKKENRRHRKDRATGQGSLFELFVPDTGAMAHEIEGFDALPDDDVTSVQLKEDAYQRYLASPDVGKARMLADAWCAAFVWPHGQEDMPPLNDFVFRMLSQPNVTVDPSQTLFQEIARIARRYRFFHWHLSFPDVFGDSSGFDCVLGNPPWEHTELKEKEFFASRNDDIVNAGTGAARKKLIAALEHTDPTLYAEYLAALRFAEGISHFIGNSGKYPLCGRGRINTYAIFAELVRQVIDGRGRAGVIVPSGIATDDTTKFYFQDIMDTGALASLYDFENRAGIFPAIDSRIKFCLLTLRGALAPTPGPSPSGRGEQGARGQVPPHQGEGFREGATTAAEFVFFAHQVSDLADKERRFTLTAEEIALLNPNTRTCATFRSRRDAEITKAIYRRVPVLIREGDAARGESDVNPWGITFKQGLFNMTSDSGLFRTREQMEAAGYALEGNHYARIADWSGVIPADNPITPQERAENPRYLPLYEAKLMHQFTHRWATYTPDGDTRDLTSDELRDPLRLVMPRYWVAEKKVREKLGGWDRDWCLGFRNIARSTDERTVISSIVPISAVGHSMPIALSDLPAEQLIGLVASLGTLPFDYIARQKLGGINLTFGYVMQFPVLPPGAFTEAIARLLRTRILELQFTAWDMMQFARDLGFQDSPFEWDENRRFMIRCELDALYFHLYGFNRSEVEFVLETFPIVQRKEMMTYGRYRTRDEVLKLYDAMSNLPSVSLSVHDLPEVTLRFPDFENWSLRFDSEDSIK